MGKKRIEWIDIFKALAIILVVVGHSTNKFNAYIYQFHVAAFFFISGWVAKMDAVSFGKDVYKKSMTLIVPLLTMVILYGILLNLLSVFHVYNYFYSEQSAPAVTMLIKNFITNGSMIDLLGAAWFIIVLFLCSLISHIIYILSGKNRVTFGLFTALIYIYGYYRLKSGNVLPFGADIAIVAQGYYGIAFLIKQRTQNIVIKNKTKNTVACISLFCTTFIMVWMKETLNGRNLMDIANRQMNSLWWCSIAVINGVLWLWALSQLVSIIKITFVKKIWSLIGKSTMGIMLIHFLLFRIVAALLAIMGIVTGSECKNLIPSTTVGEKYWWIYSIVAIVGSTILWNSMIKIPILRQMLGKDKNFMQEILQFNAFEELGKVYKKIVSALEYSMRQIKIRIFNKETIRVVIGGIIICLIMIGYRYGAYTNKLELYGQDAINGTLNVEFPYNENNIIFTSGWLKQEDGENYRWVQKESEFQVALSDQTQITMSGYVPENVKDVSNVKLYLNDNMLVDQNIIGGKKLTLQGDISNYKTEGNNVFKLVFDGEHLPDINDADQRVFSAMFTSIVIE